MGDAFKRVADGVGVVVEGVDAPLVAYVWVRVELDAVDDWVTHSCIGVFAVDLGSQGKSSLLMQSKAHLLKQSQVIL